MKNRRHDNTLVLGAGKTGAWTPHDLRRTGATLMQRLGVSIDIIDRCYADEKRDAWGRLGLHLASLLEKE